MEIPADEIYGSLRKSGQLPYGWKPARQGVRKVSIKNLQVLEALREHYPGEWRKVYQRGVDGKVWGIKVK